jgi:hypothetical protein
LAGRGKGLQEASNGIKKRRFKRAVTMSGVILDENRNGVKAKKI